MAGRGEARAALALLVALLAVGSARAQSPAAAARTDSTGPLGTFSLSGGHGPITVTADELELDYRKNVVTCRGSVVATQGGVRLESATLTLTFERGEKGKPSRVLAAVANGGVKITQGERWATGGRATFDQKRRTLTLTEHPVLHEGANQVAGDKVIVYLDEGRSVVEGGRGRVKAVLHERKEETGGALESTAAAEATRAADSAEGAESTVATEGAAAPGRAATPREEDGREP